jgi:succinate dehydrogenase / fumarate reductase cytochrome b subunit
MAHRDTLARVQSLLGIVPLGGYVIYHLVRQWPAVHGREAWLYETARHPTPTFVIALLGVLAAAHAALGIARVKRDRPIGADLSLPLVQAGTGVIIVAFVGYHVSQVWSPGQGPHAGALDVYDILWQSAGQPLPLLIYLIGITATYHHLALGASRALHTFGLVSAPRGILYARVVCGTIALVLWGLSLHLLAHYALGAPLLVW